MSSTPWPRRDRRAEILAPQLLLAWLARELARPPEQPDGEKPRAKLASEIREELSAGGVTEPELVRDLIIEGLHALETETLPTEDQLAIRRGAVSAGSVTGTRAVGRRSTAPQTKPFWAERFVRFARGLDTRPPLKLAELPGETEEQYAERKKQMKITEMRRVALEQRLAIEKRGRELGRRL